MTDWQKETPEVRGWLEGLGIVVNHTYRVVIDRRRSMMRIWQYTFDDGAFMVDGDHILRRVPFDIRLDVIPAFVKLDRYGEGLDKTVRVVYGNDKTRGGRR